MYIGGGVLTILLIILLIYLIAQITTPRAARGFASGAQKAERAPAAIPKLDGCRNVVGASPSRLQHHSVKDMAPETAAA